MNHQQNQPQNLSRMQQEKLVLNELMTRLVSELDSDYAAFPMKQTRWCSPKETLDNGSPLFIAAESEDNVKQDYIWMQERKGLRTLQAGYYHLRTHEAYIEVYSRLKKVPTGPLGTLLQSKRDRQAYTKLMEVIENRLMCDIPNDTEAARMRGVSATAPKSRGAYSRRSPKKKTNYMPTVTAVSLST